MVVVTLTTHDAIYINNEGAHAADAAVTPSNSQGLNVPAQKHRGCIVRGVWGADSAAGAVSVLHWVADVRVRVQLAISGGE